MYYFHARDDKDARDVQLRNMIHGITQQMLRADHGLYATAVSLRGDGRYELIAYPDVPKYFPSISVGRHSTFLQ